MDKILKNDFRIVVFSTFRKITVGGFVNQLIKQFWPYYNDKILLISENLVSLNCVGDIICSKKSKHMPKTMPVLIRQRYIKAHTNIYTLNCCRFVVMLMQNIVSSCQMKNENN